MISEPKSKFMQDRAFKRLREKGGSAHFGLEGGCYLDIKGEPRTTIVPAITNDMRKFLADEEYQKLHNPSANGFVIIKKRRWN